MAILCLGPFASDPKAAVLIRQGITSTSGPVRFASAVTLAHSGNSLGEKILIDALRKGDKTHRLNAALALGSLRFISDAGKQTLVDASKSDADPIVRQYAAAALSRR